jgi:hypothetical protein
MAAQLPDYILVDGIKMELYTNPLEQYWMLRKKKRPDFHTTKSCKRGYIATWELRDKQLILLAIDGNADKKILFLWRKTIRYTLRKLFPKAGEKGVLANWFSGKLRVPQGNRTLYVHHEYDSRFEREMVITIERGHVVKTVILDYAKQSLLRQG